MLRPAKCHLLQAEYLLWVSFKKKYLTNYGQNHFCIA